MPIKIYGIPNCGTCKKALKWLQDHQVEYDFIDTKVNSPTREMVQDWVETLGSKPMRNTSGQSYRALGDEKKDWTEQQWIEAFTKDAMLLKRPLFVRNSTAVLVGFKEQDSAIQEKLGL